MNGSKTQAGEQGGQDAEYAALLELDELESLLEVLEERGISDFSDNQALPADLAEQLSHYEVRDVQQLRDRIMHLHANLDDDDRDLSITDS